MQNHRKSLCCIIFLLLASCTPGILLSTAPLLDQTIDSGTFHVILYGMETPYDVETMAILDKADDSFLIESASQLQPNVHKNLAAKDAMELATSFLKRSILYSYKEVRSILGPEGQVIGYEIRPVFSPLQVRNSNFHSSYHLLPKENKVKFIVFWQEYHKPFYGDGRK